MDTTEDAGVIDVYQLKVAEVRPKKLWLPIDEVRAEDKYAAAQKIMRNIAREHPNSTSTRASTTGWRKGLGTGWVLPGTVWPLLARAASAAGGALART